MNKKRTNEENIQEICKYYYDYWKTQNGTGRELTLEEKKTITWFSKRKQCTNNKKTFHSEIANHNKYVKTRQKLK